MARGFFSGSYSAKLDEKSRFVLPQNLRYQLVENGELNFSIGLSLGGCLAIYKESEIDAIVEKFQKRKHVAKFQKFFTVFFGTLTQTTCDSVGRVTLHPSLKKAVGVDKELMIIGSMDKIEIWSKEQYESLFSAEAFACGSFDSLMEEAFADDPVEINGNLEDILKSVQTTVKL
jgi:MraZ protein